MPIHHMRGGGTVFTGDSINYFQLCAQKGVVGLELKGIMRRRPVLWKRCRDSYKIPGTGKRLASHQQVYDWMCAKVEELKAQQTHVTTDELGREITEVEGKEVS